MGQPVGDDRRAVGVPLLREVDVDSAQLELATAIRAVAALVEDLDARCLDKGS